MAFNDAAVRTVLDKVVSHAMALGLFETVNTHEPKSTPGSGLRAACWVDSIAPIQASGLAATSGKLALRMRIYSSMIAEPQDDIDPEILSAVSTLLGAYSGDFDFGGEADVRSVDLLGMYGESLSAQAGYITISNRMYRVMTVSIPVIINDLWEQVA